MGAYAFPYIYAVICGHEIEGHILGGLVTSTVLNLLVLPTLAQRYGRAQKPALESQIPTST